MIGPFFEACQLELNRSPSKGHSDICPGLLSKRFSLSAGVDIYELRYKLGLDFGQQILKGDIQPELSNSVSDLAIIWQSPVP